jgi:hypothetical protein
MLNQHYSNAYLYAGLLILSLILSSILFHNSYFILAILNNKIRVSVISIIYKKVSGLSQYMVRSADTGKIINMLANDFNSM